MATKTKVNQLWEPLWKYQKYTSPLQGKWLHVCLTRQDSHYRKLERDKQDPYQITNVYTNGAMWIQKGNVNKHLKIRHLTPHFGITPPQHIILYFTLLFLFYNFWECEQFELDSNLGGACHAQSFAVAIVEMDYSLGGLNANKKWYMISFLSLIEELGYMGNWINDNKWRRRYKYHFERKWRSRKCASLVIMEDIRITGFWDPLICIVQAKTRYHLAQIINLQ